MLLVLITGFSFAKYEKVDEIPFINARVGKFVANDIQLTMLLDGEEVDAPPSKDNYTVAVNCDKATGTWDMNEWGPNIRNITAGKVKCQVDFSTPEPTLSEVTVKPYTTSIELTYTAAGTNTTATCKYGTEEGNYPNIVEDATNTNCSITGLEKGVIYYYQVCAVNGGGEICKTGSAKTYPLSEQVKVGDYISMRPTSTSYTISKDLTGYTSDQTINPSELNLWRVIKLNEDGTVEMVSDKVSIEIVRFYGIVGYMNFVGVLNTISSQFTDGYHVLRARHVGYSNQTEWITSLKFDMGYPAPWEGATCGVWTCVDSGFTAEQEKQGAGDVGYAMDYSLIQSLYGSMIAYSSDGVPSDYFLASRGYRFSDASVSKGEWSYQIRTVSDIGSLCTGSIALDKGYSTTLVTYGRRIRPIVTLRSEAAISTGSGTSGEPYKLTNFI